MIGTTVTKKRLRDLFIRRAAALRRKPYIVCKHTSSSFCAYFVKQDKKSEARCKLPLLLLLLQGKKPYAFFSLPLQSLFASCWLCL